MAELLACQTRGYRPREVYHLFRTGDLATNRPEGVFRINTIMAKDIAQFTILVIAIYWIITVTEGVR